MGPWRPHALNPIAVDVRGSRPAGTPFRADGILYRPAQDGTSGYGRAVAINRVDLLTPSDFRETTVRRIAALGGRGGGIHTLSAVGESTLVDGKIRRVVPSTLGDRVGGRLRRMLGRDRG
jgi:hypothetical protein